jgi:hypothetical protein
MARQVRGTVEPQVSIMAEDKQSGQAIPSDHFSIGPMRSFRFDDLPPRPAQGPPERKLPPVPGRGPSNPTTIPEDEILPRKPSS